MSNSNFSELIVNIKCHMIHDSCHWFCTVEESCWCSRTVILFSHDRLRFTSCWCSRTIILFSHDRLRFTSCWCSRIVILFSHDRLRFTSCWCSRTVILFSHDRLRFTSGLKLASTDIIISNRGTIVWYCQIGLLFKFSDLWMIYWLGLSVTSILESEKCWEFGKEHIDLRIW